MSEELLLPEYKSKIVAKKGQVITLHCCTHDCGSEEHEDFTLEDDATEFDLDNMAAEFLENMKQPEYWWKIKEVRVRIVEE